MPTYSYACTECSNRFDVVQAFTDDALTTCEDCNGRLRKIFGKVGVVFKGSGFYRNDSRGKKSSTTPAASASSADKSAEKAGSAASGSTTVAASSGSSTESKSASAKPASAKPAASAS